MARSRRVEAALVVAAGAAWLMALGQSAEASPGDSTCRDDPNLGRLCVVQRDNGYDVGFQNHRVCGSVDFNLHTSDGTYGDEGAFWTRPGQYNSYFFAVGYKASAKACLYSRSSSFPPLCTDYLFG